jgi:hypothetical protein
MGVPLSGEGKPGKPPQRHFGERLPPYCKQSKWSYNFLALGISEGNG